MVYYKDGKSLTGKQTIGRVNYEFNQYGEATTVPNFTFATYTVQKGDSFWSIAWKHKVNMYTLARVSNKSIFSILHVGDAVKILKSKYF